MMEKWNAGIMGTTNKNHFELHISHASTIPIFT
jgi:hypothetical protein